MKNRVLLITALVEAALLIIVVVVGGILAIVRPHDLDFSAYIQDVTVLAAALGFAGIAAAAVTNGKKNE